MAKRAPSLGPIHRGGVDLPFLNREFKMTIHDPELVRSVACALRKLPLDPTCRSKLIVVALSSLAHRLKPFNPSIDDPIDWVAAELTRSIQAGMLMDQVPKHDQLTNKQKLAQLDALDDAISRLDEVFGELRHETWEEVLKVRADLPPDSGIVRNGIYYLWRDGKERPWHPLHETIREARRRLQNSGSARGSRPARVASRAAAEAGKVYQYVTGKKPGIYWDAAAGEYKGQCLPFVIEILRIFDIEGDATHYLRE